MDFETDASCQKLQNGSSIRKTNESVDGTEKQVLTIQKEPLNSFEECSVKVPTPRDINEPIDDVEASFQAVAQKNPENRMESRAPKENEETIIEELDCNKIPSEFKENENEFNIPCWEIRKMNQKQTRRTKKTLIQPENVSYENFNLFSVLSEDELLCEDKEKMSTGVEIPSHQRKEKTVKKVSPKQKKKKHKMSRNKVENTFHDYDDVKQIRAEKNLSWARCQNCFKKHFPYPKLCRWERYRQKIESENLDKVNKYITLPDEQKLMIKM